MHKILGTSGDTHYPSTLPHLDRNQQSSCPGMKTKTSTTTDQTMDNPNGNNSQGSNQSNGDSDSDRYQRVIIGWNSNIPSPEGLAVQHYVNSTLFNYCQFITSQSMMRYGGLIQKTICHSINLDARDAEMFWMKEGAKVTEEAIRRRRQTIGSKLKKRFYGKLQTEQWVCLWKPQKPLILTSVCTDSHQHKQKL